MAPQFMAARRVAAPGTKVRPVLFYGLFALLFGTNVLTLVGFLMAPDIAALLDGRNKLVLAAYEDRIAQLRMEVDRLHSRQYARTGDINLQLQELAQHQEALLEQHQYVKQLAAKAAELGIETASVAPQEPEGALPALTGALSSSSTAGQQIEAIGEAVDAMMEESRLALATISTEANSASDQILDELDGLGIHPELPETDAMGGPYLPATGTSDSFSIVDEANAVVAALARFSVARGAIDAAPVHMPISGSMRMSSSFGNRKDPFTGKRAFHSGTDFPSPSGTVVLAAGKGTVTFVGKRSGYGNVVEVDHGGGIVTRYAHLSAFLVKEGQSVSTGAPIARVGSTGRSTGPHLHFEVRYKDRAVDPVQYLSAGQRLLKFLAA